MADRTEGTSVSVLFLLGIFGTQCVYELHIGAVIRVELTRRFLGTMFL